MSERRFLQFKNWKTEDASEPIEVTGKTEREIEKIERGMLRNCDIEGGWFVNDFTAQVDQSPKGGDACGSVEDESAVREADVPNPLPTSSEAPQDGASQEDVR